MIIYLIGYMGCGKTSIGRPLAKRLGFDFLDIDAEIEGRTGLKVAQIFQQQGEESFRALEREMLHEVAAKQNVIVATGGGVPCFFDNMAFMNATGLTIYFKMSPDKLLKRLEHGKDKRPLLQGKTDEELLQFIEENISKREAFYNQAKMIMACDSLSDDYIANHVVMYVENHHLN